MRLSQTAASHVRVAAFGAGLDDGLEDIARQRAGAVVLRQRQDPEE
jgi:hypothetical protein